MRLISRGDEFANGVLRSSFKAIVRVIRKEAKDLNPLQVIRFFERQKAVRTRCFVFSELDELSGSRESVDSSPAPEPSSRTFIVTRFEYIIAYRRRKRK